MTTYRWNANSAAEAFDACAPAIHPYYLAVQDEILRLLTERATGPKYIVDLGGGSGRLVERVLEQFPDARATVIDQSSAFLAIAERRLARFGSRASFMEKRLQDDWPAALPSQPDALVSMSAIHHLEPAEKRTLYQRCYDALAPCGMFLNGDELRPESDAEYLASMQWWSHHKAQETAANRIPESFRPMSEAWHERNITRFGEPKQSGDDCHETAAVQLEYLREAGFRDVRLTWNERLWGVLVGRR